MIPYKLYASGNENILILSGVANKVGFRFAGRIEIRYLQKNILI